MSKKKVSVSYLSSKDIVNDLKKLDDTSADFIHVDVMDGKFVPNKTLPFSEIKNIYKFTNKRLDVHLMTKDIEKDIKKYASLNVEYITFQIEVDKNIEENLKLIKNYSIKSGLAISPSTKVKELVPYLPLIDMILVMSVEPGAGGQEFIKETENKLKEVKALLKSYKKDIVISVDGGIDNNTKKYCENADMLVSGSYIVLGSANFEEKINSLR